MQQGVARITADSIGSGTSIASSVDIPDFLNDHLNLGNDRDILNMQVKEMKRKLEKLYAPIVKGIEWRGVE